MNAFTYRSLIGRDRRSCVLRQDLRLNYVRRLRVQQQTYGARLARSRWPMNVDGGCVVTTLALRYSRPVCFNCVAHGYYGTFLETILARRVAVITGF